MSVSRNPKIVAYSSEMNDNSAESFAAVFRQHFPTADITVLEGGKKPDREHLKDAEILLMQSSGYEQCIEDAKNVKWIQFTSAGFDGLSSHVKRTGRLPPCKVTRMAGTFSTVMAEYVIANIVSHERKFSTMREAQKSKRWAKEDVWIFRPLSELTIGIVGAGDIGCVVAKHCKSFGMRTIGLVSRERSETERSPYIDEYRLLPQLDSLLSESDVICSVLPSTPATKEFYKEDTFKACTKKPIFINIGRGTAVKSTTLIKSLSNGWLSAAVLDVTDPEPLPPDSPLWDTPGVTISPHVCGYVPEKWLTRLFISNYTKYLKGEQLEHEIDVSTLEK